MARAGEGLATGQERVNKIAEGLASETIGIYDRDVWDTVKRQGTA